MSFIINEILSYSILGGVFFVVLMILGLLVFSGIAFIIEFVIEVIKELKRRKII